MNILHGYKLVGYFTLKKYIVKPCRSLSENYNSYVKKSELFETKKIKDQSYGRPSKMYFKN